jgi:hypothetical protein
LNVLSKLGNQGLEWRLEPEAFTAAGDVQFETCRRSHPFRNGYRRSLRSWSKRPRQGRNGCMRSSSTVFAWRRASSAARPSFCRAPASTGQPDIPACPRRSAPYGQRLPILTANCAASAPTVYRVSPRCKPRRTGQGACVWSFTPSTYCISRAATRRACRSRSARRSCSRS